MTDKEILNKVLKKVNKDLSLLEFESNYSNNDLLIYKYIFSHSFAKAFWGKEQHISDEWWIYRENWEHHLEVMVLEQEPIKYLEKFL